MSPSPGSNYLYPAPEFSVPRRYGLQSWFPLAVPQVTTYSPCDKYNLALPKVQEMPGLHSPSGYHFPCLIPMLYLSLEVSTATNRSLLTSAFKHTLLCPGHALPSHLLVSHTSCVESPCLTHAGFLELLKAAQCPMTRLPTLL